MRNGGIASFDPLRNASRRMTPAAIIAEHWSFRGQAHDAP